MRGLRLALVLVVLTAVWVLADGQAALARLARAEVGWLLAAFALIHAQTVLSALRWRMVAGAMGMPMTMAQAVREYYVAQLGNQTLPGGVAGDAARAVRARQGAGLAPAATAVVVERLAGQGALLAVLVAGMAGSMAFGAIRWPAATLPVAAAALVALLALGATLRHPRLAAVRQAAWSALAAPGQWALSLLIVAANLGSLAAAARATGTALPLEAIVTLLPLILTAMVLPLGIAGWGWREGATVVLFPLAGASPAAGLAASTAFGMLVLAAALPGALWVWRGRAS